MTSASVPVNVTTFSPPSSHPTQELAAGVALTSFAILLGLIAFVIAIVTPQGFCSIRRRWIRRMKRVFGAASQTLMTEIRGEEFYAVPLEEMADLGDQTPPPQSQSQSQENDDEPGAGGSNSNRRERDMISMYKQRGIL